MKFSKKYKLVGVVLLWVVHMDDVHYALFMGVPGPQLIPFVSCNIVRAIFPTVNSHPTNVKHDF